jgi:hypothetical protein
MERTNEKPVELTTQHLDIVTGGTATTGPKQLPPRNPFGPPKQLAH